MKLIAHIVLEHRREAVQAFDLPVDPALVTVHDDGSAVVILADARRTWRLHLTERDVAALVRGLSRRRH